jgi:hypothetical protein
MCCTKTKQIHKMQMRPMCIMRTVCIVPFFCVTCLSSKYEVLLCVVIKSYSVYKMYFDEIIQAC